MTAAALINAMMASATRGLRMSTLSRKSFAKQIIPVVVGSIFAYAIFDDIKHTAVTAFLILVTVIWMEDD